MQIDYDLFTVLCVQIVVLHIPNNNKKLHKNDQKKFLTLETSLISEWISFSEHKCKFSSMVRLFFALPKNIHKYFCP